MIASAVVQTCEGELRQIAQRGNWELSESEYIGIIAEKTAALFSAACAVGAILAGADEKQVKMLADYGHNTGIAFQITDDLLDLVGDKKKTGKTVGSDLDKDKLTLPVIHLLSTAGRKMGKSLFGKPGDEPINRHRRADLLARLRNNGCLAYAQKRAEEFAQRAIAAIEGLRRSEGRTALIETARFAARRTV
jgi:geranylgeranyl pyrophosphate synthase